MRAVVISDNQVTCAGFRLVGMECRQAKTAEELETALQAVALPETGLIVVTSALATKCRDVMEKFQESDMPLVVEIPDEGAIV